MKKLVRVRKNRAGSDFKHTLEVVGHAVKVNTDSECGADLTQKYKDLVDSLMFDIKCKWVRKEEYDFFIEAKTKYYVVQVEPREF